LVRNNNKKAGAETMQELLLSGSWVGWARLLLLWLCLVYAWFICLVYFMGFSEENEIVPGING